MARPAINKVEYFSHDAGASHSKTLTIIEGEWGNDGYAFWFKLLERLADSDNHFIDCRNEEDFEFLSRKCGADPVSATGILNKLAKLGAIDPELWSAKLIWSENFAKRLSEVYRKRGRPTPPKPSFCDDNSITLPMKIEIPATETPIPTAVMPQSKVKYINNNIINDDNVKNHTASITDLKSKVKSITDKSPYGEGLKQVFAGIDKRRGYKPPRRSAEAKAIRSMLKAGYLPDQILTTWDTLKKDKFWDNKELYMMSVEAQIGALTNGNGHKGKRNPIWEPEQ